MKKHKKQAFFPALKSTSDIARFFEAAGFEVRKIEGRYNAHFTLEIYKYDENRKTDSFICW